LPKLLILIEAFSLLILVKTKKWVELCEPWFVVAYDNGRIIKKQLKEEK